MLTKHVPFTLLNEHLERMNVEIIGGRVETAPGLNYLRPEPWAEDAANDGYESRTTDQSRAAEADRIVNCENLRQERAKSQEKVMETSSFTHGAVASPCVANRCPKVEAGSCMCGAVASPHIAKRCSTSHTTEFREQSVDERSAGRHKIRAVTSARPTSPVKDLPRQEGDTESETFAWADVEFDDGADNS